MIRATKGMGIAAEFNVNGMRTDRMNQDVQNKRTGVFQTALLTVLLLAMFVMLLPGQALAWPGKTTSCTSCHGTADTTNATITTAIDGVVGTTATVPVGGGSFEVDARFTNLTPAGETVGMQIAVPGPNGPATPVVPTDWGIAAGTANNPAIPGWNTNWDIAGSNGAGTSDYFAPGGKVPWDPSGQYPNTSAANSIDFTNGGWGPGGNTGAYDDTTNPGLDGVANDMGFDAIITVPADTPAGVYDVVVQGIGHVDGGTTKGHITQIITVTVSAGASPPTVTTPTATAIGSTGATLGANVTSDGGDALTARGTCWDTTATPRANCVAEGGTATGIFTQARTGLPAASQVYYAGYATNGQGTSYTSDGSFFTEPATQASGVNFTAVNANDMTINWTRGSGSEVIVLAHAAAAVDSDPADGTYTGYTANAAFGSGTQVGVGNYVVYKGTGTSVTMTGLTSSTTYHVAVYELAGAADTAGDAQGTNYLLTPATGNQATVAGNSPANVPTLPAQYESDGSTVISVGGYSTTTTLVFEGDLSDPDGDTVKLQIDYTGDNVFDCEGSLVASGSTNVQVSCPGLTDGNSYDWQYRAVDSNAAASAWTAYNGASPDFIVDATAPSVSSTVPTDGAPAVAVDSQVTINFDENVNCATVNTTNITSDSPGWALNTCSGSQAIFDTSGQAQTTTYNVNVSTAVTDLAGNALSAAYPFSFTTTGPVCTNSDPTVTITTADQQITAGSGNVVYNVDVTNNDTAACGDTTFSLSVSDSNSTDFATSLLGTANLLVSPAATQSTTLTVAAVASPTNGSTNSSDVTSAAAGPHGAVTSNAVNTRINIPGTPTMHYNVGDLVHIEFRTNTRFSNQGVNAVSILTSTGAVELAATTMTEVQSGAQWIYTYDWDSTAKAADSYQVQVNSGGTTVALTTVVLANAAAQVHLFADAAYTTPASVFADSDTVYVEVKLPSPETTITADDVSNFYGAAGFVPTNNITQTGTTFRFNFVVDFISASVADGDWGWFYWSGTDTGIEFHAPIKRSDAGCGTCTYGTPTVSIVTGNQAISTDGGNASYTLNITNTDTVACGSTAFDLVAIDTNSTEFAASTFVTDPLTVAPGAIGSTTLTVNAQAGNFSATNDTYFYSALDVNHAQSANSNTVTTTLNVPDVVAPSVAISDPTGGSYINAASPNPYTVSGSASDDRGVTLVEVSIDSGGYVAATGLGPWTYSWSLPADGVHTIDARASDGTNIGNATQVSVTVDTAVPTTSDDVLAPWTITDRTVNLIEDDVTSGVASTVYCVDTANSCVPGTAYAAPFAVTQTAGQESVQYLRYFSTDNASNVQGTQSTPVNIDKKSPVDGASLTAIGGNNQVSLSWDPATDNGSGLHSTAAYRIWRQVGAVAPACGAGTEIGTGFTVTSHIDGTAANGTQYSYRVCAYDLVGNAPSTGLTGTATPAAACTYNTPSVNLTANQDITSDGGFVDYTITVNNNDAGGCAAQTFDVKTVTDSAGGFTISYPNGTTTASIGSGGNDTTLVARVTAGGGTLNAATHTLGVSTDGSGDVNHADSLEVQRTTTMNVACSAPAVSIDTANQTINVDGGTAAYTVSVDWSGGAVACGTRSFDLVPADSNATDFVPSVFTTDPLSVTPGAAASTTTLTVDSNPGVPDLSSNNTYFYTALNSNAQGSVAQSGNSNTVTTTVDRPCVRNQPSFGYGSNKSIDVAGAGVYTLTVINNDVDCAATSFSVALGAETGDTGAFSLPSVVAGSPVSVNAGASNSSITLTVTGNGTGVAGNTLTSNLTLSSANHTDEVAAPVTTIQPNNPLLHNSISTGSSKWGGNWGVSGGQYGKFECSTCHSANKADLDNGTDFNIKRVRATISTPDATAWGSSGAVTTSVRFTDANDSPTGVGFGDDSDAHTTSNRVCEACHSQNKYHNYNVADNTLNTHNNNTNCVSCHKHSEGFKGGGNCASCHDYPPDPAAGNAAFAVEGEGRHPEHVSHLVTLLGTGALDPDLDAFGDAKTIAICGACHDMTAANHETGGGTRVINFGGDPGTATDDNDYRFAPAGSPSYLGTQGQPSTSVEKRCSNVSCHFQETPVWE